MSPPLGKRKLAKNPKKDKEEDVEKGPEKAHNDKDDSKIGSDSNKVKRNTLIHSKDKDKVKEKAEKGNDDKFEYDPEDDVWTLEDAKPSLGRKYARSVIQAIRPVMVISNFLGLFPLIPVREKDGTYTIKFSWFSFATILFLLMATIIITSTIWIVISVICIFVNFPDHPSTKTKTSEISRSEEIFVYKRNIGTLIITVSSFIHLTVCMVCVFLRRDYIAKQLVYWTEVVELLQLDVGLNVAKRLWKHLIIILVFGVVLVVLYVMEYSPGLAGAGSTVYVMLARMVNHGIWHPGMKARKSVCAVLLLYCIFGGYLYILWFFYNCRILKNILSIWNNRFQYCLHKHALEMTSTDQGKNQRPGFSTSSRTSRAQLFQDHLVIFNLLEGVNAQFEVIMESFYLSTMIMIVFEAYGFVHACFYHEYIKCNRQSDIIPLLLFLALQLYLYITVILEAAGVADEARHVLDVVRRKGMMTSRMDNELWFMLSMRLSFGGHEDVGIIGAGFFYVTKSFLLGAISAITSHFIIYYQFEVPYSQTSEGDANLLKLNHSGLIMQLEGKMTLSDKALKDCFV